MCPAMRGGIVLRCVGRPLESLGAASSNLMARRRGLPRPGARAYSVRRATARAPFHFRGEGEPFSDDGVRGPQQAHRMGAADRRLNVSNHNEQENSVMGEVKKLRPLVLGYARLAPFAGQAKLTAVQAELSAFAHSAGLQLGTVYFERTGTPPHFDHDDPAPAFGDLLNAIERNQARGVLVPSLSDFGDLQDERITHLEDELGVVVRAADVEDADDASTDLRP